MPNIVDARGRSCPEPVIMTKRAMEENNSDVLEVLVDAMVAVENIKRYATGQGLKVDVKENEDDFCLTIRK